MGASVLDQNTLVKAYQLLREYELETRTNAEGWDNMGGPASAHIRHQRRDALAARSAAIMAVANELQRCWRYGRKDTHAMTSRDEIEITDKMVSAGLRAFYLFDQDDRPEQIIRTVFREMLAASRLRPSIRQ